MIMTENAEASVQLLSTLNNIKEWKAFLNASFPIDLADLIQSQPPEKRIAIFEALTPQLAVQTFEYISFPIQKEILANLTSYKAAKLLNDLSPDDRTAFLEGLPSSIVNQLLKILSPEERTITLKLLGYPEGSVGRLMTPDYVAVKMDWTVKQVLDYIRKHGRNSETINIIYVIDDQGILIDDIRIRYFLFAPPNAKVSDLADRKFVALLATDNEETAVNAFRKYNRAALPVVDEKGLLLGIVTVDDILRVADEEHTEDIQKIGGMEALDEPYMQTSFFNLMKKRVGWLILLFLGEMITASAMGYFEHTLSNAVVLALFIPLIISSGGNSGSQASTLIIRAMALGEVTLKDWWRIMQLDLCALRWAAIYSMHMATIGSF
jgi:magnesium transporter